MIHLYIVSGLALVQRLEMWYKESKEMDQQYRDQELAVVQKSGTCSPQGLGIQSVQRSGTSIYRNQGLVLYRE